MNNEYVKSTENTIRNTADEVRDRVKTTASQARETVSDAVDGAADGLNRISSKVHEASDSLPPSIGQFAHSIANGVGSAAGYLHESDVNTIGKDIMSIYRRYPTRSILAVLAVGFLIGRSRHNQLTYSNASPRRQPRV